MVAAEFKKIQKEKNEKRKLLDDAKLTFFNTGSERNASWDAASTVKAKRAMTASVTKMLSMLNKAWPKGTTVNGPNGAVDVKSFIKLVMGSADAKDPKSAVYSDILMVLGGLEEKSEWFIITMYVEKVLEVLGA